MQYIYIYMTVSISLMKITHNVYYRHIFFELYSLLKNKILSFLHLPQKSAYNILLVSRKKVTKK